MEMNLKKTARKTNQPTRNVGDDCDFCNGFCEAGFCCDENNNDCADSDGECCPPNDYIDHWYCTLDGCW